MALRQYEKLAIDLRSHRRDVRFSAAVRASRDAGSYSIGGFRTQNVVLVETSSESELPIKGGRF